MSPIRANIFCKLVSVSSCFSCQRAASSYFSVSAMRHCEWKTSKTRQLRPKSVIFKIFQVQNTALVHQTKECCQILNRHIPVWHMMFFLCHDISGIADCTLSHIIEHHGACRKDVYTKLFQEQWYGNKVGNPSTGALHPLTSFLLTSWCAFEVVFRIQTRANTTTSTRPRKKKMSTTSPGVTSRKSSGQHHRTLAQNVWVRKRPRNLTRPYWTILYRTEQLCPLLN